MMSPCDHCGAETKAKLFGAWFCRACFVKYHGESQAATLWDSPDDAASRRVPGMEPPPLSLCFCESGRTYQDCHKPKLHYYVFEHPSLFDRWDVLAYGLSDAFDRFSDAWKDRTKPGGDCEHLSGARFEDGKVEPAT
jgi:SEC-C motif-containing protein